MTDREEREEHIKRLEAVLACEEKQSSGKCSKQTCDDNCALLYEQGNWGEWKETLRYAINSLKTDLKYDLLYEETSGQADKNDLALIHTWGLDEEIRCTICTNSMKSNRGCDGSCVVNKDMYKAVMDAIEKRIQPATTMPPVTPQEPKSEWEHDHEILRAYADGANNVLDKLRAEIAKYGSIMVSYAITKDTKTDKGIEKLVSGVLKQAKEQVLEVIDKYKAESEE